MNTSVRIGITVKQVHILRQRLTKEKFSPRNAEYVADVYLEEKKGTAKKVTVVMAAKKPHPTPVSASARGWEISGDNVKPLKLRVEHYHRTVYWSAVHKMTVYVDISQGDEPQYFVEIEVNTGESKDFLLEFARDTLGLGEISKKTLDIGD